MGDFYEKSSEVANAIYDVFNSVAEKFGELQNETLLMNHDILELAPEFLDTQFAIEDAESVAINFDYILRTGEIPQDAKDSNTVQPNQHIDWKSDDALTRAITDIRASAKDRIHDTPELQELLDKDIWERSDRVTWEKGISEIISEETAKIPGLGTYRIVGNANPDRKAERRATRINDLSEDIENGTTKIEHDCETMSIIEGSILQQTEKDMLRPHGFGADYKEATNYFYGSASMSLNGTDLTGGHAFIISSATGNIIEATARPSNNTNSSTYKENANPNHNFSDFIKTGVSLQENNSVYISGNGYISGDKDEFERATEARLEANMHIGSKIYGTIPKEWQPKSGTIITAESGVLALLHVPAKDLENFQKQILEEDEAFPKNIIVEGKSVPAFTALEDLSVFLTMEEHFEKNGNEEQLETMKKFERLDDNEEPRRKQRGIRSMELEKSKLPIFV